MKRGVRLGSWCRSRLHTRRFRGRKPAERSVSYEAPGAFAQLAGGPASYETAPRGGNRLRVPCRMKPQSRLASWCRSWLHTKCLPGQKPAERRVSYEAQTRTAMKGTTHSDLRRPNRGRASRRLVTPMVTKYRIDLYTGKQASGNAATDLLKRSWCAMTDSNRRP